MRVHCWIGLLFVLMATCVVAPPAAAQQRPPTTDGVVLVEIAGASTVLGFATGQVVAGEMRVVTNFLRTNANPNNADFVVRAGETGRHDADLFRYDDATGLAVLTVRGLTVPPYPFASVAAVEDEAGLR